MRLASLAALSACALGCVLLLATASRAQDNSGDDPLLGTGGPGQPGTMDPNDPQMVKAKKRGWTSQQLLLWKWDEGYAASKPGGAPLSVKDALAALAGHDPRPLLIRRECDGCDRDDHKLLDRELTNDKTVLYAWWFHSVRVSADVVKPDNPFHALFEGRTPPHLVAATFDGSLVSPLGVRANQSDLWRMFGGVLRKTYKKDPDAAVKSMLALLDDLDHCDNDLATLDDKLIQVKQAKGEESKDAKKLEEQKKVLTDERTVLLAKGKALVDLGLRTDPAAAGTPAAPGG